MTTAQGNKKSKAEKRGQRLAAELRANLKKRKAQARQRQVTATAEPTTVNETDPDTSQNTKPHTRFYSSA